MCTRVRQNFQHVWKPSLLGKWDNYLPTRFVVDTPAVLWHSLQWKIIVEFQYTLMIKSIILSLKSQMWCDQAKSVWSWSNSVFIFLTNGMHHFHSYILQKIPLKLVNWFHRYEQFKDAKNNRKQKTFSALFGSILKSIFPTSDWFCLITSQIIIMIKWWLIFSKSYSKCVTDD